MAKKPRNLYVDWAVYVAVRFAVCAIQAVPLRVAMGFGIFLGYLGYLVDKRHREVARDNLRHAFPELCDDPVECERLVRACYRHFGLMVVEIACIPRRLHGPIWRTMIAVDGLQTFVGLVLGNRPLVIVTAHFGNWEVAGYMTGVAGLNTYAIARVLDNPYLHRFMLKFRQKTGQTILNKTGDFERISAALDRGGIIATLGDQDAGERGLFVDFFHRPASTHKAVALLSLQYDAPMVVSGVARVGMPLKFKCFIEDVIDPRDYVGHRGNAIRDMTIRFTKAFERMIRRYPEQYFWLHRRWKHKPPVPASKQADNANPGQSTANAPQLLG